MTSVDTLLEAIQQARIFDLSHPLTPSMPQLPGAPRFQLSLLRRHGDTTRGEGYSSANELLVAMQHSGTHIDAIGHVSVDGRLYGGLDAAEVQQGPVGLKALGIETVEPIIRRGVLLDVARELGLETLEPGFGIDGTLLERTRQRSGASIGAGDIVLVRTGWGGLWGEPERYVSATDGLPGVNDDGARWLADREIFATGADCLMFESFTPTDNRLPVHCRLIQGSGIHLVENMNLEAVAAAGVTECLVVILPLLLVGATASQVRPIAIA